MKQKKLGDILYVFTDEPYEITEDTDASIVYVQAHSKEGFEALNPDLTFKKINYNVFTVKEPEWKEYLIAQDEESEEPSDNPVTPDPTPTPTPVEPEPTPTPTPSESSEYNFISYDTSDQTIEKQNGKFTVVPNTAVDGKVQITVTEATEPGPSDMFWLTTGNSYWISDSYVADSNNIYDIYVEVNGSAPGIGIKIISIAA